MSMYIIFLLMVFFVPFPPAYFIYQKLPSEIVVRGPFKGLNIKLTGAFGGYFLLVLIAISFAYFALKPSKPNYEIWELKGQIEAESIDPNTGTQTKNITGITIEVTPPNYSVDTKGGFDIPIMVIPAHVGGRRKYPTLKIGRPGYTAEVLRLNDEDIKIDEKMKAIRLRQRVILERMKEKPKWD